MEFNRRLDAPPALEAGNNNLTNRLSGRCSLESFNTIAKLTGAKTMKSEKGEINWYGILEGCSVVSRLEADDFEEISVLTYNTYAQLFEELVINNRTFKTDIYYGQMVDGTIQLKSGAGGEPKNRRLTIGDNSFVVTQSSGNAQKPNFEFKFKRF